jgi:uncharacterized protein (DUF3084 family)
LRQNRPVEFEVVHGSRDTVHGEIGNLKRLSASLEGELRTIEEQSRNLGDVLTQLNQQQQRENKQCTSVHGSSLRD